MNEYLFEFSKDNKDYSSCLLSPNLINDYLESKGIYNLSYSEKEKIVSRNPKDYYSWWGNQYKTSLFYDSSINDFPFLINSIEASISNIAINLQNSKSSLDIMPFSFSRTNILLYKPNYSFPESVSFLKNVYFVQQIVIKTPIIVSSSDNIRKGVFKEGKYCLKNTNFNVANYIAVSIIVNGEIGICLFNKKYIHFIPGLTALFQIATLNKDDHISFVLVFGVNVPAQESYYYLTKEGIYIGVCPDVNGIDYFGYVKKMILTLFNLKMISYNRLPIHGACINIKLKGGKDIIATILGDSGAGKSETIEALRKISRGYIESISTVYDDMGTFSLGKDGNVYTTGTEIGAFVRLDDLDIGFSLKNIDESVYMNIDRKNARVIIPATSYKNTVEFHKVDMFLLANNFIKSVNHLFKFSDKETAIKEFSDAPRVAKGTTNEVGLVHTFFANPFGPVQEQEKVEKLINVYFSSLFKNNIYVGKLYTELAIDRINGPLKGAGELLELINKEYANEK